MDYCFIIGELQVSALDVYLACIPLDQRTGKFWRKIVPKEDKFVATKQIVGRNLTNQVFKHIARRLGKANWEEFTGHCGRRMSVTFLAGQGSCNLLKLKGSQWFLQD